MKTILEDFNRKTDNRFVYAIGVFCLLSMCLSQFPERKKKPKFVKTDIAMVSNLGNTIDIVQLPNYK